jgi:hypothetical protein
MSLQQQSPASEAFPGWNELVEAVRRESAVAVERTIDQMGTLRSYAALDPETLRETVESRFVQVIAGLADRRPPGLSTDETEFDNYGELRARQGVTFADLQTGWRFGG